MCVKKLMLFSFSCLCRKTKSLDNPILDANTNVIGTVNLLEDEEYGVKRIVYSSSAAIFDKLN